MGAVAVTSVSSIGPAFDYLLNTLPAVLVVVDPKVQVSEDWPDDATAQRQFIIGRAGPSHGETAAVGSNALITLGAGRVDEDYDIPCFIQVISGGQGDQKVCRDAAMAIWNGFVSFLARDRTLGGSLSQWAEIKQLQYDGTPETFIGAGRSALITFTISCKNKYIP